MSTEQEWLKERTKGIGGSDAAATIGQNPNKTNVELWEEKTGRRKAPDISDKECVIFGKLAEYPIREIFKLDYPQYEISHEEFKTVLNKDFPFIRGSFDGVLTEKETGRKGILEIKTTEILNSIQLEKWKGRVPDNYFCQILHYFLVNPDFKFAILKARLKSVWEGEIRATIRHYRFERKDYEADLKFLLEQEIKFWDCVLKDIRPGLILPHI